jgi:O-antigen/teichoic acid export membrane protein
MKKFRLALHGSVLRVVGLVATTFVGFFLMPFIVHHLGDRTYGFWALIAAVLGYYGLLDLGIVTAVQYHVAKAIGDKDDGAINGAISTSFFAFTALGLITFLISLGIVAFSQFIVHNHDDLFLFRTVMLILGTGAAVGFPGRAFVGAISAHLRFDLMSSASIALLIVRTVLILLIIGNGGGIIALAGISLLIDASSYIVNYIILKRIQPGLRITRSLASMGRLKEMFHYSGYAVVIQLSDQIRFSIDGWMVGIFVSVAAVTHYSIASRLSQSFLTLIIAMVGILAPWFSQLFGNSDFDGIKRVFLFGTKISASLATIVALSFVLYGKVFISKWMGLSYVDAYLPMMLLVLGIYCDVSQLPSVSYMYGVSKHRFLAGITLAEGIANFLLSLYWARKFGMAGVALGSLVPMAVAKLLVQPAYVCKSLKLSLYQYYIKLWGRSVLAPGIPIFLIWFLWGRKIEFPNVLIVCTVILLQAVVAGIIAFFLIFGRPEQKDLLGKLVPTKKVQLSGSEA